MCGADAGCSAMNDQSLCEFLMCSFGTRVPAVSSRGHGTGHTERLQGTSINLVLEFRVEGLRFRVQGSEFRVQGSGFRVQGLGFRV